MTSCASDEIEVTSTQEYNAGSVAGVVIATVIVLIFIVSYLVVKFQAKDVKKIKAGVKVGKAKSVSGQVYRSLFDRIGGFFGGSIGKFSIGMLVAILISDVVGAFNGWIINPIIQVAIPDPKIFSVGIPLGRNDANGNPIQFFPGQFLLSLLGFILSLVVIFFLIEGFYQISKLPRTREIMKYLVLFIIVGALLALMGWNIYAVVTTPEVKTECVPRVAPGGTVPGGPLQAIQMSKIGEIKTTEPPVPSRTVVDTMGGAFDIRF